MMCGSDNLFLISVKPFVHYDEKILHFPLTAVSKQGLTYFGNGDVYLYICIWRHVRTLCTNIAVFYINTFSNPAMKDKRMKSV